MPINAGYEYLNAEKEYLEAKTLDEKIKCLEEMIRTSPKHKGSENLVAELKRRLIKFQEKKEKAKKTGKSSKKGIKKEGYQIVLLGLTNSGKSSLLAKLTNAKPIISSNQFTTKEPEIGTLYHKGMKAQIIDLPSIGSEFLDTGLIHTADKIIILITSLSDLDRINPYLSRATSKRIIAINKSDILTGEQIRKLEETIKSRKLNGIIISTLTCHNIELLKDKIFQDSGFIRVYTKEPGKSPANDPVMLPLNSSVKDVAESIRNGFSKQVKEARITGPSSKFPNQKVGLSHVLKDLDIVEFHTH